VGIVSANERIVSQWGLFPVYEHDVCELQERYGDEVRYFEMPPPGESMKLFLKYAKQRGVSDTYLAQITAA
jgi:hypothetical protein